MDGDEASGWGREGGVPEAFLRLIFIQGAVTSSLVLSASAAFKEVHELRREGLRGAGVTSSLSQPQSRVLESRLIQSVGNRVARLYRDL